MSIEARIRQLEKEIARKSKEPMKFEIHLNPCYDCEGCEKCQSYHEEANILDGRVIHVNGED